MDRENIEEILKGIGGEDVPADVRKIAEETSVHFGKTLTQTRQHILWSDIMKSRIIKLTAAAVIILAVVLSITILDKSVTPAYAIEQTIEAMKNVTVVHIFGRDWDEKEVEMWIKVNPQTGRGEYYWLDAPSEGKISVATPEKTYIHNKNNNTVLIRDGLGVSSVFSPGRFLEEMSKLTEQIDGTISNYRVYDPAAKKDVILLLVASNRIDLKATVDPDTKLPLSVEIIGGSQPGSNEILKHADHIYYGQQPPEGIFDLKVPIGAEILDETVVDAQQQLPDSVIEYAVDHHLNIVNNITMVDDILANTHIYVVNGQFNLIRGGFVGLYNYSDQAWSSEVKLMSTDRSNLAFFDESGKKQKLRVVQRKALSPGKYTIYWQLEEPILPGEARGGIYWVNTPKKLKQTPDGAYRLTMRNFFGQEVVESFILVIQSGTQLHQISEDYTSYDQIGGYDIYIWKKHIPTRQDNVVNVQLKSPAEH